MHHGPDGETDVLGHPDILHVAVDIRRIPPRRTAACGPCSKFDPSHGLPEREHNEARVVSSETSRILSEGLVQSPAPRVDSRKLVQGNNVVKLLTLAATYRYFSESECERWKRTHQFTRSRILGAVQ